VKIKRGPVFFGKFSAGFPVRFLCSETVPNKQKHPFGIMRGADFGDHTELEEFAILLPLPEQKNRSVPPEIRLGPKRFVHKYFSFSRGFRK